MMSGEMEIGVKNPVPWAGFFILRIEVDPVVELKPERETFPFFLSKFLVNSPRSFFNYRVDIILSL
jgi:hypothetical protein